MTSLKGIKKRLATLTLEKKATILDNEVAEQKQEDEILIRDYLEVDAARYGIRGGQEKLKQKILKIKNETEKKRFEKYKKMSAKKLAEMRSKKSPNKV